MHHEYSTLGHMDLHLVVGSGAMTRGRHCAHPRFQYKPHLSFFSNILYGVQIYPSNLMQAKILYTIYTPIRMHHNALEYMEVQELNKERKKKTWMYIFSLP
jgi:hypothetical protein